MVVLLAGWHWHWHRDKWCGTWAALAAKVLQSNWPAGWLNATLDFCKPPTSTHVPDFKVCSHHHRHHTENILPSQLQPTSLINTISAHCLLDISTESTSNSAFDTTPLSLYNERVHLAIFDLHQTCLDEPLPTTTVTKRHPVFSSGPESPSKHPSGSFSHGISQAFTFTMASSNLPSSFASAAAGQNSGRDRNNGRGDSRGSSSGEW